MNIEARPLGNEYRFESKESDIVEVFDSLSGLRIIISTWIDEVNETLFEVYFRYVHGYRYLDEGDLIAYWQGETFRTPHHVYEITNGGWLSERSCGTRHSRNRKRLRIPGMVHLHNEWLHERAGEGSSRAQRSQEVMHVTALVSEELSAWLRSFDQSPHRCVWH